MDEIIEPRDHQLDHRVQIVEPLDQNTIAFVLLCHFDSWVMESAIVLPYHSHGSWELK